MQEVPFVDRSASKACNQSVVLASCHPMSMYACSMSLSAAPCDQAEPKAEAGPYVSRIRGKKKTHDFGTRSHVGFGTGQSRHSVAPDLRCHLRMQVQLVCFPFPLPACIRSRNARRMLQNSCVSTDDGHAYVRCVHAFR